MDGWLSGGHEPVGTCENVLHGAGPHRYRIGAVRQPDVRRIELLHLIDDALERLLDHVRCVDVRSELRIDRRIPIQSRSPLAIFRLSPEELVKPSHIHHLTLTAT